MSKISVKPEKISLRNLLERIAEGKIRIPVFQRNFVWKPKQMLELFDSIVKGYPIGSLLLWKPEVPYDTFPKIGPYKIQEQGPKEILYVLDGYQRLTTLFGVLSNPKEYGIDENNPELKRFSICYDLKDMEDRDIKFKYIKNSKNIYQIHLYKLLDTYEYLDYIEDLRSKISDKEETKKLIDKCKLINKIFFDYEIPYIEINGGDIESAVEIFSRVNSTGEPIDIDYMLSALSYNVNTSFLLSDKITEFLNSLSEYNFNTLNRDTILNCIINSKGKFYYDIKVEDLKVWKSEFEQLAQSAFIHIKEAVEFTYKFLYVFDVKLLPYPSQLIFISEFFRLNSDKSQINYAKKLELLKEWFWITSYSNYFTASLAFQRNAYSTFVEFAEREYSHNRNGLAELNADDLLEIGTTSRTTLPFPDKLDFTGVRPKALKLFMLKQIIGENKIEIEESIKEMFIYSKKGRTPANIIVRRGSEFEKDPNKKNITNFILESDEETLRKYFVNEKMQILFSEGREEEFLSAREELIRESERKFVENLNIQYTN